VVNWMPTKLAVKPSVIDSNTNINCQSSGDD
jgi:hypothetical protein